MNQRTTNGTDEVLELQQRWTEAELRGDAATLDQLLADDFLAVGPFGFVLTKGEWLDRYRSGDLKNEALAWSETSVRRYADTAVVVGAQSQKTTYQGNAVPIDRVRVTMIAVGQGGRWRIAGVHLSMIAPPPGR